MTTEWKDLPDLQSVAKAQAEGWDIERIWNGGTWCKWSGDIWSSETKYRGRPAQPKTKKVVSECWRNKNNGALSWGQWVPPEHWQRFPAGDIEGEVEAND